MEIVDGKLPLPDLRIEYLDSNGDLHHDDNEIVSRHYHGAHLTGKIAAGFKLVGGGKRSGNAAAPDHFDKGLFR